jgi:uncharacterized membrane protein
MSGEEAKSEGADIEGLRLPNSGSVTEASEDAGSPGEDSERPDRGDQRSLVERRGSDPRSVEDHPGQEQFPQSVTSPLEVVGYAWSGPLPPPSDLAGYESIVPGSAERIIAMAELAVRGPIEKTAKLTEAEIDASKLGLSFAIKLTAAMTFAAVVFFALAVAGIGVTAALTAGGVCLSVPVVMLIRSFITRSLPCRERRGAPPWYLLPDEYSGQRS